MKKYIDAELLIEDFKTSGQFDISELGAIIPIIEDQPAVIMPKVSREVKHDA